MKDVKFKEELVKLNEEAKRLYSVYKNDNRFDEAKFEKVKTNVYDIYTKMFNISVRSEDVVTSFKRFLSNIPKNWYESLEKAKYNNDFETEHIEQVKIETKNLIEELFEGIYYG